MLYLGLRHFTYAGQRIEPGMVFRKLAVRNNHFLEARNYVEEYRGKEDKLVPCQGCSAKFANHEDQQRHTNRNVHKDGKVIYSDDPSAIRGKEQEEAIEAAMKENPERPGKVEANAAGEMSRKGSKKKIARA